MLPETIALLRSERGLFGLVLLERYCDIVRLGNRNETHIDRFDDRLGDYLVFLVVGDLNSPAPFRFVHGALHALGSNIGI